MAADLVLTHDSVPQESQALLTEPIRRPKLMKSVAQNNQKDKASTRPYDQISQSGQLPSLDLLYIHDGVMQTVSQHAPQIFDCAQSSNVTSSNAASQNHIHPSQFPSNHMNQNLHPKSNLSNFSQELQSKSLEKGELSSAKTAIFEQDSAVFEAANREISLMQQYLHHFIVDEQSDGRMVSYNILYTTSTNS